MNKIRKIYFLMCLCGMLSFYAEAFEFNFNANPWSNSIAEKTSPLKEQSQVVLNNEHPVFTVNVYNPSQEKVFTEVRLIDNSGNTISDDVFCLRTRVQIRTQSGTLVSDPLPRLNKEQIIPVSSQESRQLWIEFNTAKLKPGLYNYILKAKDINTSSIKELKLSLKVLPIVSNLRPDLLVWDCSLRGTTGKTRKKLLKELVDSGVNIFHLICSIPVQFDQDGNMCGAPDFKELDLLVKDLKPHSRVLLLRAAGLFKQRKHRANHKGYLKSKSGKTITFGSSAWKEAVSQWTKAVSAHLASKGIPNSKWAFYPYDEYLGSGFVTFAQTAKSAVPQVQIFGNPAGRSTQKYLGEIASKKLIDIICPTAARYYSQDGERQKLYNALGNSKIRKLFYFAGWPQKDFSPLKMYRFQSWRALAWNTDGWGYWTATGAGKNLWGGNPWDDFDRLRPNPESLYIEKDVVIPSRRWRAVRAGVEDYALVQLARQKAKSEADKDIINKAVSAIMSNPEDYKNYDLQRNIIIELLMKIEGLE